MTADELDTARYRDGLHRWCIEKQTYNSGDPCMTCGTILLLCDEIDRLRAEIAASWDVCDRPGGCVPGRPW